MFNVKIINVMKSIKKNILKPLLFAGLGLTIATIVFARGPFHVASAPGKPSTVAVWRDGCELKFKRPADDGGTPITRYIIESRSALSARWVRSATFIPRPKEEDEGGIVDIMQEGLQVVFRAMAVNAAGIGEPSEQSELVLFKDR